MRLAIAGDLFILHPEKIKIDKDVVDKLDSADCFIVNLEGPIGDEVYNELPVKSGIRLLQPKSVLQTLDNLGVNVLTMANNHIMDYGEEGLKKTIEIIGERYSVIGCGNWQEAYRMHVVEKDGLRVGVVNLCELQIGVLNDHWTQTENEIGCAWINYTSVDSLIVNYKKHVDCLIAIVHCGVEREITPLPEWRDRYRKLIDLGCDAVIAHHPHVVQGTEIYKGAPICYSLGNFIFVSNIKLDMDWNTGAVAFLDVSKEGVNLNTCGVRLTKNQTTLSLVDEEEWSSINDKTMKYLSDEIYMQSVNEMCVRLLDLYRELFAMGGVFSVNSRWLKNIARVLLHRYHPIHSLNNIRCESHRWCISRGLKLKNNLHV